MNLLEKAAAITLKRCMGLKQKESCLVIYDKGTKKLAEIFYNEAGRITPNARLLEKPVGKVHSEEPPQYVAEEMLKYDVVLIPTTKSMSHTLARKKACEAGARIASMPNITEHAMRAIDVDYEEINRLGKKIKGALEAGSNLRLTTKIGTDITMEIRKNRIICDNGNYTKKGAWGNLPCGEVAFAPIEESANGIYVVGASMSGIGLVKKGIMVTVKGGRAVKIEGGLEAKGLRKLIGGIENAANIAELGIGINKKACIIGTVLEDEKVFGTAHIALGDSFSLGGKVQAGCHLDGVITSPTIFIDDKKIMECGRLLI